MLQLNKSPLVSVGGGRSIPFASPSPAEMFKSFTDFLRRQFSIILFFVLMGIGLGVTYAITTPPMFTAQTSMLIDTHKVQLFRKQDQPSNNTSIDTGLVESEVEMLKSENVSLAVIKRFNLVDDPEFSGRVGSVFHRLLGAVSDLFLRDTPKSEYERTRRAAAVFADRLTIRRVGVSYIIQISFELLDPKRAADIADAVANAYIVDQLQAQFQVARQAGVWLQDRLRELREQATAAERAVVDFKAKNNIVKTGGNDSKRLMDEQQVGELNSQLVIARAQVSESRARLDRIQAVLRTGSPDATVDATVTDTLKNEVITKLRSQYLTLAEREADWSRRYGKNHLAVINTRNQMNEIKNSIFDELQRIAELYKSDYEIAKQRQTGIEHELDQAVVQSQVVDRAQVQLMELESNAQSYRTLYDDFLLRYTESVQQQSFPMTQARVITPAARPLTKSHPKTLLVLLISAAGGMIVGLMIGHLRDLTDRVFRTRDQVERLLALDCLATVPKIKVDRPKGNSSHAESKVGKPPEVGSTPAPDVKAGEPNVNLSSAADVKVDKTNGDMLTALDVKVGELTGDASAAPCIETGEPNDGLSAVPGIETGEPNDGLSAILGIEADEPNTASPPAPDLKVSMPKVAPWPDPDIIIDGPKDDASPDPDINVGGPKDGASPDPDINVGRPKDDASPDPDINVGGPKDDASPDPDINVGGRKDDAPPDPDINGGEANVDPVPDPDITVSMSEGDPSPVGGDGRPVTSSKNYRARRPAALAGSGFSAVAVCRSNSVD